MCILETPIIPDVAVCHNVAMTTVVSRQVSLLHVHAVTSSRGLPCAYKLIFQLECVYRLQECHCV